MALTNVELEIERCRMERFRLNLERCTLEDERKSRNAAIKEGITVAITFATLAGGLFVGLPALGRRMEKYYEEHPCKGYAAVEQTERCLDLTDGCPCPVTTPPSQYIGGDPNYGSRFTYVADGQGMFREIR